MPTLQAAKGGRDTLNLRIKPELRGLIDRAAELTGKNRTDFVLTAARHAAEDTIMDRTVFAVDAKAPRHQASRCIGDDLPTYGTEEIFVTATSREPTSAH